MKCQQQDWKKNGSACQKNEKNNQKKSNCQRNKQSKKKIFSDKQ
jgi:hypothetical protein